MPSPTDDYYALLGVDVGADAEALRKAWRRLAMQWHPDRAGPDATATFQRLASAYAVLSDPIARAAYDRRRRAAQPASASRTAASATRSATEAAPRSATGGPQATRRAAPSVMLQRLSGPLNALIACGAARREEPGFITLVLRSDEATRGGMATISMQVDVKCKQCAGRGCERCGGTGAVRELFAAWLAVPPGVTTGEVLAPSVELPGTITPVRFKVRLHPTK